MANRAERRAQERAQRHAQNTASERDRQEAGARMLMETVMQNRGDAVMRALTALFEQDPMDEKVWRLKGLGGAVGQIQADALNEVANAAVMSGLLLPGIEEPTTVEPDLPEEAGAAAEAVLAYNEAQEAAAKEEPSDG